MASDTDETQGTSLAAFALVQTLLVTLNSKKVISDSEIDGMLETALSAVETSFGPGDQNVQSARKLLEALSNRLRRPSRNR